MPPRRTAAAAWLAPLPLLVAALGFVGCGPGGGQNNCPFEPPVCPDPEPSYSGEVAALIQQFCVGCHGPGGREAIRPFATYDDIVNNNYAGPMQRQLLACQMPPADAPQLSAEQKAALVGWLTCGAHKN